MSVYFAERDGLIKIGCSGNPKRRAREQAAELVGLIPDGTFADERRLHLLFADERTEGEWFAQSERLCRFVGALPAVRFLNTALTTKQVAEVFNVTPDTIRRWADQGKLPHYRIFGGSRRFPLSALTERYPDWLAS